MAECRRADIKPMSVPPIILAAVLAALVASVGCGSKHADDAAMPSQDVYVWQRVWTPPLAGALKNLPINGAIHVLAEQWQRGASTVTVEPDFKSLRASGHWVIPVIRLHGSTIPPPEAAQWQARLPALIDRWQSEGLSIAGIEFDHDAPSGRLATWRDTLQIWRAALPPGVSLRITALPAWMDAPADLRQLAESVDGFVLQVHAVEHPRRGLFDPDRAETWVRQFSKSQPKPFQVSVPAYGSRVALTADGERIVDVRSETPTLSGLDPDSFELIANPEAVQRFAQKLAHDAPAKFTGIAWFRLPLSNDRRAWSSTTWRAIVHGERLNANFIVSTRPTEVDGVVNVWLHNGGSLDAVPPAAIRTGTSCTAADGADVYRFSQRPQPRWQRHTHRPIHAGSAVYVGWARCSRPQESFDVIP